MKQRASLARLGEERVYRSTHTRVSEIVFDYIIVGAGIYGLPLAALLAAGHEGSRNILVVEDNQIAGQCITVNTGGIIRACYSDPAVMRVADFSRRFFMDPGGMLGTMLSLSTGFVRTGWARFVSERADPQALRNVERIAANAAKARISGIHVCTVTEYLQAASLERRSNLRKILDMGDVTHVLVDEHGGYADGATALLAFYQVALSCGVHVSLNSSVVGFLRSGRRIEGVVIERWSTGHGGARTRDRLEEIRGNRVVLAAGQGNARLVRTATELEMPTFPSYHQLPHVRNTSELALAREATPVPSDEGRVPTPTRICAAPVVSHWRGLYFRPEGSGLLVGAHHHVLHPDDYEPTGGTIDMGGSRLYVGLDQIMVDTLLANMEYFPVLMSSGLYLGRRPSDIPGGVYYMNPEELPFEGEVPDTEGTLFYIGSGCGTGFKLGPGVAYLLWQRLSGVPASDRLVSSVALSAERADYFFPKGTARDELLALFGPASAGGRLRRIGAAGIGTHEEPRLRREP